MLIAERINAERLVLAGWSRAILLQLAHPLVAQGVADHSAFRGGLLRAAVRLHHTVAAMRHLTFGDDDTRRRALAGILAIHRRVNGKLRESVGVWPAGTAYSAEDPSLVLWVHATLLDSLALVFDRVVRPLADDERDAWCRESAPTALSLGAHEADVPRDWGSLQAYVARMHASGQIVVGDTARDLARDVLTPPRSWLVLPARTLNTTVTIGLLPRHVREQYGLAWTPADDRRLSRALWMLRTARRVTPTALAHWPDARRT
ncbi:hypothetical protein TBR22_A02160 [Luteitalea sp. TBR-22]|uniref:oxygenase MpaB family protein n=1 Tax=Luteitalea sp. TBR-22 TaxID=2802971 RepID=UPI001AFB1152|nr:oxygenase MpaB family protein [Luteitalea sp. TBR-22]BCS31017.1 hypothetical protein TBR22_A02160 [Luteitalea sp. TBR-22]